MGISYKHQINKNRLPSHVAMIMDGNGRWAKDQGKGRIFGHYQGVETVRRMVEACSEIGIKYLTLYAFSTENWRRPKEEVNALMELLVSTIRNEIQKLHENKVRVHTFGQTSDLPQKCQNEIAEAVDLTKDNTGLNVALALSYSSHWDIAHASKQIAKEVSEGKLRPEDVDEESVRTRLSTCNFPYPELLIRTSGEHRISNFLLWELAYSELYFTQIPWPAFQKEDLYEALVNFQTRERRFGKISEQINDEAT